MPEEIDLTSPVSPKPKPPDPRDTYVVATPGGIVRTTGEERVVLVGRDGEPIEATGPLARGLQAQGRTPFLYVCFGFAFDLSDQQFSDKLREAYKHKQEYAMGRAIADLVCRGGAILTEGPMLERVTENFDRWMPTLMEYALPYHFCSVEHEKLPVGTELSTDLREIDLSDPNSVVMEEPLYQYRTVITMLDGHRVQRGRLR